MEKANRQKKWLWAAVAVVLVCLTVAAGVCARGWLREYRRLEAARNGIAEDVITVFHEFYFSDYEDFCHIAREDRLDECYSIHRVQVQHLKTFLKMDGYTDAPGLVTDRVMYWYGLLLCVLDEAGPTQELEETFERVAPYFSLLFDWDGLPREQSPGDALSQSLRVVEQELQKGDPVRVNVWVEGLMKRTQG